MKNYLLAPTLFIAITLYAQKTKTVIINDTLTTTASLIYSDNFNGNLQNWQAQHEIAGGSVEIKNSKMEITANRGCTVWFTKFLKAPLMIEYDAVMIDKGGRLDRVSDLNCFWMATDPNDPSGKFINGDELSGNLGDYNKLKLYYVGLGGRENTTTRFRRYPGTGTRPMLPEHDLRDKKHLLTGNTVNRIRIIVYNTIVQYYRNGQLIFNFNDPAPLSFGYFGFRTTINHMTTDNFKVFKLSEN